MRLDATLTGFLRDVRAGASDTRLLLDAKWHHLTRLSTRLSLIAAALVALGTVVMSANLGYGIKIVAIQQPDTTAGIFANTWILSLQRNELGSIGAITIGAAVLAAIVAPFTGSSTLSTSPPEDTQTLRPARLHRYYESWLINAISGIGLLQLIALTAVASVLTIEGNRTPVMTLSWALWLLLVTTTTTIGWTLEWGTRRWGKRTRTLLATAGLALTGSIIAWDLATPTVSLLTLGDVYAQWANTLATTTNIVQQYMPTLLVLVVAATIAVVGLAATWQGLSLPAPVAAASKPRRPRPLPAGAIAASIRLTWATLWRTPESRRPLLAILIIGAPAMALFTLNENVESALMLAIPAAISLAWGVNIFGLFGAGMPWLASQPRILTALPRVAATTQFALTIILVWLLWLVSFLTGNTDQATGQRLLLGSLIAASLSTAISTYLSTTRPVRARLTGRGDSLTPPLTTLAYLGVLVIAACLPAIIVVGTVPPPYQTPITGALVLVAVAVWFLADRRWSDPVLRARVCAVVGA